jgi:hypothetical protein
MAPLPHPGTPAELNYSTHQSHRKRPIFSAKSLSSQIPVDFKPDAVPEQYTTSCLCQAHRKKQPCRTHDKEEGNSRLSSKQYTLRHRMKRNRAAVKKVKARKRKPDKDLNEDIVARRTLELNSKEGEKKAYTKIKIEIRKPEPDPEDIWHCWRCPFRIIGYGDEKIHYVYGVDSIQALYFALQMVGMYFWPSQQDGVDITWNGDPDLGLPLPDSLKKPLPDGPSATPEAIDTEKSS